MRNKHTIKMTMSVTCPFDDCGKTFRKQVKITYWTNQRGDVIDWSVTS